MDSHSRFPACLVKFPALKGRKRAAFYLAAEEYIASRFPEDDYFFSWILPPTVVMGRNQAIHQELNLDFCRQEGIDIIRRKSGGGCIYADEGNIMFSLVTTAGAVEPVFSDYATRMAAALTATGIPAEVSGRNDILLANGAKICGNAFYHLAHRNIVHGTMLYDTDYRLMTGALTPDRQKLQSAGVKSVRSRTGLIKNVLPIGAETLRSRLETQLCNRSVILTAHDITEIGHLETAYYAPDFLYGKTSCTETSTAGRRIAQCGRVEVRLSLHQNRITDIELIGDFFATDDAAAAFRQAFTGTTLTPDSISEAITAHHPEHTVRGLTADALLEIMAACCPQTPFDNP